MSKEKKEPLDKRKQMRFTQSQLEYAKQEAIRLSVERGETVTSSDVIREALEERRRKQK